MKERKEKERNQDREERTKRKKRKKIHRQKKKDLGSALDITVGKCFYERGSESEIIVTTFPDLSFADYFSPRPVIGGIVCASRQPWGF